MLRRASFVARSSLRRISWNGNQPKRYFNEVPGSKSKFRGPVTYGSLGIIFLGGVIAWFSFYIEKEDKIEDMTKKVKNTGKPALGGPWVLVDQDGIPRTDASFHGKYVIYYFGFTHCPDICPSELVKVAKIVKKLGMQQNFSLCCVLIFSCR
jgi:protein SCO1/2